MSLRTTIGWGVAALITLALAVWSVLATPGTARVTTAGEPVFPALRAEPEAAERIVIRSTLGDFTLERRADGVWVAREKHGYPVKRDQVQKLLVALSDMRLIEPKTRNPERYPRIDVEDVTIEGSESRLVRVETGDGRVLAEAILGQERRRFTGGRDSGIYLRRPGEAQAWLASGGLFVKRRIEDWMDPEVVNLAAAEVAEVAIAPAEGPAYAARRSAPEEPLMLAPPPPEGREADQEAVDRLASALSFVQMKDVVPAAEKPLPETRTVARFTTFAGVEVTAETAKADDSYWLQLRARWVGEGAPDEAAQRLLAEIEERTAGWTYEVAQYIHDRLAKPYDALLKREAAGS